MANMWLRLWHDMPNDPKWRTIARASKQTVSTVLAVYLHILVNASNAPERGRTHNLQTEDIASAIDVDAEVVDAIRDAMEGRVMQAGVLTGWQKRQPIREDSSAERGKAWRERNRTQCDAPDKDTEEIKRNTKATTSAKAQPSQETTKFTEFRNAFEKYFEHVNRVPAPWDGKEAANLSRWLKKNPTITLEQWQGILRNRAKSPVNHALELSAWIGKALTWVGKAGDEFGRGASNAGNDKIAATADALDRARARRGQDHGGAGGDVLLPAGGADRRVPRRVLEASSAGVPAGRAGVAGEVGRAAGRAVRVAVAGPRDDPEAPTGAEHVGGVK